MAQGSVCKGRARFLMPGLYRCMKNGHYLSCPVCVGAYRTTRYLMSGLGGCMKHGHDLSCPVCTGL